MAARPVVAERTRRRGGSRQSTEARVRVIQTWPKSEPGQTQFIHGTVEAAKNNQGPRSATRRSAAQLEAQRRGQKAGK